MVTILPLGPSFIIGIITFSPSLFCPWFFFQKMEMYWALLPFYLFIFYFISDIYLFSKKFILFYFLISKIHLKWYEVQIGSNPFLQLASMPAHLLALSQSCWKRIYKLNCSIKELVSFSLDNNQIQLQCGSWTFLYLMLWKS